MRKNAHSCVRLVRSTVVLFFVLGAVFCPLPPVEAQTDDPAPPSEVVKLIFIHHSCGENWLTDDHGNLGQTLGSNNYFVSDTNYGWGPDSIGDRTDITDWPEWFTGPNSDRYLTALYAESGQNSWYTRTPSDPGGENSIIMFKSCFPNSNLHGSPHDPPARSGGLTVSNAKAIYNELLAYFATRPDKLFVVITAPPVQDPTFAANARAFNTWLVTEWLKGYPGTNVAVFDFYNVLTGPDNHHRFHNGTIEYVTDQEGDTLYYPTNGDNHPSPTGNGKATQEFVSLLNVYYHRWQSGAPSPPTATPSPKPISPTATPQPTPAPPTAVTGEAPSPQPQPSPPDVGRVVDDFESGINTWDVFLGQGDSQLACGRDDAHAYSGTASLHIEYDIAPDDWASCSLVYPSLRDWRDEQGLTVYLRAERAGQKVTIALYQGSSPDSLSHFELHLQTNQKAVTGWQRVEVLWDQLAQPPWEGDGTARFDPGQTMGLAFLFSAPPTQRNPGQLWVDEISFLSATPIPPTPIEAPPIETGSSPTVPPTPTAMPSPTPPPSATEPTTTVTEEPDAVQPTEQAEEAPGKGICPGSAAMGMAILLGGVWAQRRILPFKRAG